MEFSMTGLRKMTFNTGGC